MTIDKAGGGEAMKKSIAVLAVFIAFGAFGAGFAHAQEVEWQTGFHTDWWTSPNGDVGQQIYFPLISGIRYNDFAMRVVAGGAYTTFNQDSKTSSSLGAMLDTKLNLSYEYAQKWPVDVLVALDMNLPSGTTNLSKNEMRLIMDPDLISVTTLGEGFNVNPSVMFSRQWGEQWVTGVGFGYNFRGQYDYSYQVQSYSPGDIFSIVPEVRYYFAEQWMSRLYGNFSTYGKAKSNDQDFSQQGDFFLIGAGVTHTRKDWAAGLNLFGIIRSKDTLYIQNSDLTYVNSYAFNQGDEIVADLSFSYFLDEKTTFKTLARYLWMSSNDQPLSSPLYWGQRNYFALGVGVARKLTSNIEAECGVKGLTMHDEPNWNHFGRDQSFFGMAGQLMISGLF
jgi:hypothetical protein